MKILEIKSFNVELTTRCNGKCPLCRHQFSREKDLPLQDFIYFFNKDVLNTLSEIKLYGSLGDPALHPNFKEILSYLKKSNPKLRLNISTNGSMFDEIWWSDIASILNEHDEVHFGLDGTEETNKIYRGTSFKKVLNNMKSFIKGGGNAKWLFICFKHNEKELEYLKDLSSRIGAEFIPRYSSEYTENLKIPEIKIEESPVKEHFIPFCPIMHNQVYLGVEGIISPCPFLRIFCDNVLEQGKGFYSEKEILINFYKNKNFLDIKKITYFDLIDSEYLLWVKGNIPNFTNCKLCGFK